MMDHPLDVDLLIFDVDGTLLECTTAGQRCPYRPGEWRLRPNVQTTIQNYPLRYWHPEEATGTVELALVSNQAGVAPGHRSHTMARILLWQTLAEALREPWQVCDTLPPVGLSVHGCASDSDQPDTRCKPNPGMLCDVMTQHGVLPERTLMVGGGPEAMLAAQQANVPFMWASRFFDWDPPP